MSYVELVRELAGDPERLELAYREAVRAGDGDAFAEALEEAYANAEDNLLYGAWHFRLLHAAAGAGRRIIAWWWALPLAVLNGLLLWLLSSETSQTVLVATSPSGMEYELMPAVALLAAPITAVVIAVFLAGTGVGAGPGARRWRRVLAVAVGLAAFSGYVVLAYPLLGPRVYQEHYLVLMIMNLALLAWAGVGVCVLLGCWDEENRFAFLLKSLEVAVVGGIFAIVGGMFTAVTFLLFSALGVYPSEVVVRLFVAGGAGLIAVLAAAVAVDPGIQPRRQRFDEGASRLIAMTLRMLLPLALVVLAVFVALIPANFREPLENRDVLIAFNVTLFAVVGLLVGVTPLHRGDLGRRPRTWLRWGVVALAALALVVGVYAMVAIVYRTTSDRLTPNRLTFIGWNAINIALLAWVLVGQWRWRRSGRAEGRGADRLEEDVTGGAIDGDESRLDAAREAGGPAGGGESGWLGALHASLSAGMAPYVVWAAFTLLALPWLFGTDLGQIERLPQTIQEIAFNEPYPVLLKCSASPHVYLLEQGEKHWIKDIPTFQAQGFRWSDVRMVSCADIDAVPDGEPIPPDSGQPPDD